MNDLNEVKTEKDVHMTDFILSGLLVWKPKAIFASAICKKFNIIKTEIY